MNTEMLCAKVQKIKLTCTKQQKLNIVPLESQEWFTERQTFCEKLNQLQSNLQLFEILFVLPHHLCSSVSEQR